MKDKYLLDVDWVLLMAITVLNATITESVDTGLLVTILVASSVALKGHQVIEHFMGLIVANPILRKLMNAYFYVIPAMIVLVKAFPETIATFTQSN